MTEVSVIVPVYNGEKTIERCVDSVLAQTMAVELIVVNDGSADATGEILKRYGDRIKLLNLEKNVGQGKARNAGIEISTGRCLGFVDADDTVEKEMYEKMYAAAIRDNAQVVQCAVNDIRNGRAQARSAMNETVVIKNRGEYVMNYFYRPRHTNEVCNKLIEKSFLTENSLKFPDTREVFSEDMLLNIEIIQRLDRITFVDGVYYNYYISPSGHCLSDTEGRMTKMMHLFDIAFEKSMDDDVRKAFECTASLTMLMYCARGMDEARECVKKLLRDRRLERYNRTSMMYQSSPKHALLMFAVLHSPMAAKLALVKKFYTF